MQKNLYFLCWFKCICIWSFITLLWGSTTSFLCHFEVPGGVFLRPLWDLIYSYYYNTQLSITELLFSNKGPTPFAGEVESRITKAQFSWSQSILSPPPPPSTPFFPPQIMSLSFLQWKDICSPFPSPFSLLAGRGRTSKAVLGLLITLPAIVMYLESSESS